MDKTKLNCKTVKMDWGDSVVCRDSNDGVTLSSLSTGEGLGNLKGVTIDDSDLKDKVEIYLIKD